MKVFETKRKRSLGQSVQELLERLTERFTCNAKTTSQQRLDNKSTSHFVCGLDVTQ